MNARVSVITVTLNRPSLLAACESVEKQTYTNWHHYVIGDGVLPADLRSDKRSSFGFTRALGAEEPGLNMPDGTPNPLQRWALKNLDVSDYICFLDDDNVYRPDFLGKMVAALAQAPNAGLALCGVEDLRHKQNIDGYPEPSRCDNSGVMYRRSVVKAIEFPRASIEKNVIQDCEYIQICAVRHGWINVPETLVTFGSSPNKPTPRGGIKLLESWQGPLFARDLIVEGKYDLAIQELQGAILMDANDAWSVWALGEAYLFKGERDLFRQCMRQWYDLAVAAKYINNHWVECSKAIALMAAGEGDTSSLSQEYLDRSVAMADALLSENENDQYLLFSKGLYLALQQHEDALSIYREALDGDRSGFAYKNALWKLKVVSNIPQLSGRIKEVLSLF